MRRIQTGFAKGGKYFRNLQDRGRRQEFLTAIPVLLFHSAMISLADPMALS
jgi:glucokinase